MDMMEVPSEESSSRSGRAYGLQKELRKNIVDLLGNIEEGVVTAIVRVLEETGVVTITDLEHITEDDLRGVITPIQIRKLLRGWCKPFVTVLGNKPPSPSPSSLSSMSSVGDSPWSSPTRSLFSVSENPNQDPNWPVKLEIPWDTFGHDIRENLIKGKRLSPELRRELVRKVVEVVRSKTKHATRQQMSVIAQRMVAKYPESLQDTVGKSVIGSGYDVLLNKLTARNQNLNRSHETERVNRDNRKRSNDSADTDTDESSVNPRKDSYGCVKWGPVMSEAELNSMQTARDELYSLFQSCSTLNSRTESLMTMCYALQRRDINSGMSMKDLKTMWPFLFNVNSLLHHGKELMGIDLRDALGNSYSSKAPRLNKFFRSASPKMETVFLEAKKQSNQDNIKAWLSAVIICIIRHLGDEENDMFFVVEENCSVEELERKSTMSTESPMMVVLGESVLGAKEYMLICDHVVISPRTTSFIDAFAAYFACYYIFNLEYQPGVASTLEFVQRCFMGINPDRGSKGNKGKKKKTNMASKVVKLIESLSNFEWLDEP